MKNDIEYSLVSEDYRFSICVDSYGFANIDVSDLDGICKAIIIVDKEDIRKLRDMLYNAENDIERIESNKIKTSDGSH